MQSTVYRFFCCITLNLFAMLAVAQDEPPTDTVPYDGIINIELHYPAQVEAGAAISLRATITNHGRGTYVNISEMGALSGVHNESYSHHRPCEIACNHGTYFLPENEPVLIDLGNYYYDSV